jgi:site-specific recombinase XerD
VDRYGAMQWDLWYRLRTHLHERGTDIKLSQALLGNNEIKTRMRYTQVGSGSLEKIVSPFDQLSLQAWKQYKN